MRARHDGNGHELEESVQSARDVWFRWLEALGERVVQIKYDGFRAVHPVRGRSRLCIVLGRHTSGDIKKINGKLGVSLSDRGL